MDRFVTTYLVNWRIGPMCMLPGFTLGGGNTTLKPDCRTWKLVLGLSGKQNIWASCEKADVWVYDYCSCCDFWRVFAFCCGSSLFRNRILRKDSIRVPLGRVNCFSKSVWQDRVSILLGLHRPFVYLFLRADRTLVHSLDDHGLHLWVEIINLLGNLSVINQEKGPF